MNDKQKETWPVRCLACEKSGKPYYWDKTAAYGLMGIRMAQLCCSGCARVIEIREPKLIGAA